MNIKINKSIYQPRGIIWGFGIAANQINADIFSDLPSNTQSGAMRRKPGR
ncbi:hypothetical protein [Fodinibius sp.]